MDLSHLDENNKPKMVDVSGKQPSARTARARAEVVLPEPVLSCLEGDELRSPKGPVFQTAIVAGVMAAKKTSEWIPFCHPVGLEDCRIEIRIDGNKAVIDSTCTVTHKTGVEMEALTAVTAAALTIYDMCKGLSHDIEISNVSLLEKRGGKSDYVAG